MAKEGEPKASRSEEILAAQKAAVDHFGTFVKEAADLASRWEFNPGSWLKVYGGLWSSWANDFAAATRAFLKD